MSSEVRGVLASFATSERSSGASSRSIQVWEESGDNREGCQGHRQLHISSLALRNVLDFLKHMLLP